MQQEINNNIIHFVDLVNSKLKKREPFAFIRYGDGESMILGGIPNEVDFVLNRQIGQSLDKDSIIEIQNNLLTSYLQADCLGLPTDLHLRREDHWNSSLLTLQKNIDISLKYRTSIDICYEMLYCGELKNLLQDKETVNYISCRNLDKELKEKYNIKNINSYIIAPEVKFTSGYEGEDHYPTQYLKIKEWITTIPCEGNVCLVGAGVIGKIYNIWFRDQGGISLDIGGVFDLLAGKKTRGQGRGVDKIDNTYKL